MYVIIVSPPGHTPYYVAASGYTWDIGRATKFVDYETAEATYFVRAVANGNVALFGMVQEI